MKHRETSYAAVHGVAESDVTEWLNNNKINEFDGIAMETIQTKPNKQTNPTPKESRIIKEHQWVVEQFQAG